MKVRKRLWPVVMSGIIGCCILLALGTWQVFRLKEKTALLARIDSQIMAAPVTLAQALARREQGKDLEYLAVAGQGRFLPGRELRLLTSFEGGPGFTIVAPFLTDDGILVLVDRGKVPEALADPANRPQPLPTSVKGYLRAHSMGPGIFDGENSPETNLWFWWDVPAMLASIDAPPEARVLDVILHRLPDGPDQAPPTAPAPKAEIRNSHLGYAITWYGLALALAAICVILIVRERRT